MLKAWLEVPPKQLFYLSSVTRLTRGRHVLSRSCCHKSSQRAQKPPPLRTCYWCTALHSSVSIAGRLLQCIERVLVCGPLPRAPTVVLSRRTSVFRRIVASSPTHTHTHTHGCGAPTTGIWYARRRGPSAPVSKDTLLEALL